MLVGCAKLSWMEMVGNAIGSPPASITPRFAAAIRSGTLPWHGLKSENVSVMPTIGRSSASSENPIALMKALRRNSENPASP